jgi:hypothetical protein
MPFIEDVLKEYGLPNDLKFVPMVESRYNRYVVSTAGAVGIWQTMAEEGMDDGMDINSSNKGIDDRNRVIKSTHTACRNWKRYYKMFGSWTLAAAAYNWGPGHIIKTIKKQGTRNYYEMSLNDETAAYVYELVSFKMLYELLIQKKIDSYYESNKAFLKDSLPAKSSITIEKTFAPEVMNKIESAGAKTITFKKTKTSSFPAEKNGEDSTFVPVRIIANAGLQENKEVTLRTIDEVIINGRKIPKSTIIIGRIFEAKGDRIFISAAGIEVNNALAEYDIRVCDEDNVEGIAVKLSGDARQNIAEGYMANLKFVKE